MEVRTAQRRAVAWLAAVPTNPWFAYGSITVLALHVLWSVGVNGDLVLGDTAYHSSGAQAWFGGAPTGAASSPGYLFILGSSFRLLGDIPAGVFGHRVVLVLVAAALVLAIGRRLLPAWAAWLVAAWWVHLPAVHDTLYAIHIAGAAAGLAVVYVAVGTPSRAQRAATLAVLVVGAILIRSELLAAAVPIAAICWWVDGRQGRQGPWYRSPYVLAAVVIVVTALGTLRAVRTSASTALQTFRDYSELSLCQHYAYNDVEQGDFDGSPWTECFEVMRRDFGRDHPSLARAAVSSPGNLARHVAYNASHLPATFQYGLFGAPSGDYNPDVVPRRTGDDRSLVLSIGAVALLGAAVVLRSRARLRIDWPRRAPGLLMAASVGVAFLAGLVTLRPRPSYVIAPLALAMLVLGAAAAVVARAARIERWVAAAVAPLAAVLLVVVPPYREPAPRPSLVAFRAVESHRDVFEPPELVAVATWRVAGACVYLVRPQGCGVLEWGQLLEPGESSADAVAAALDRSGATVAFAAGADIAVWPGLVAFLASAPQSGWSLVALRPGSDPESYFLLTRQPPPAADPGATADR